MLIRPPAHAADAIAIRGGRPLAGAVRVAGYKHATVPMLAAAALGTSRIEFSNVPDIEDRRVMCRILSEMGARVTWCDGSLTIEPGLMVPMSVPASVSAQVHGTLYLLPALLGRFGFVEIGPAGGCSFDRRDALGSRPMHHLTRVLEEFGATFDVKADRIVGRLPRGRYRATRVLIPDYYDDPATRTGPLASGATKTALLAASVASGTSTIEEPLRTAEIAELIAFLLMAGVAIEDRGSQLVVEGRAEIGGARHALMSDPLEVFTYAVCAAYTGGQIVLEGLTGDRLRTALAPEVEHLERMGVGIAWEGSTLRVSPPDGALRGLDLEILPQASVHPDNQPLFSLLLLSADRPCSVVDRVWSNRFTHADQLARLGARVEVRGGKLRTAPGRPARPGQTVVGKDLRCACVLLIAALAIEGETTLLGASHLRRGYQDIVGDLRRLGADIR